MRNQTLTNLAYALGALILGWVAQGFFLQGSLRDGLLVYALAVPFFVYAMRQAWPVWPELPVPTVPAVPGLRRLWVASFLAAALSANVLGLILFPRTEGSVRPWVIHAASLLFFFLAIYLSESRSGGPRSSISRQELALLVGILVLATIFRFHQLETMPPGLFYDEAQNGLDARGVLEGGTYPVYFAANYGRGNLYIFLLALGFRLMGQSVLTMRVVSALIGLLTPLAFYLLFRHIGGRRTGLAAAFLVAVAHWHVNFSRVVFDAILLPLFLALTLWGLLRGLSSGRRVDYAWGGLALGLGFYTYAAFRLIPFALLLFLLYLAITHWRGLRAAYQGILIFWLAALLVCTPLAQYALHNWETFTSRTEMASIFKKRDQPNLTLAVLNNTQKHLLMFNYQGDNNPRHNLPGEPMLDPVTALFFAMGTGLALTRWRNPYMFLFLTLFVCSLLGGILSVDFEAPQGLRSIGSLLPAIFFAATTLEAVGVEWQRVWGPARMRPFLAALIALLPFIAYKNYDIYFRQQAHDYRVWSAFMVAETTTARIMAEHGPGYAYYISPFYVDHPSIRFIAPEITHSEVLPLPDALPVRHPADRPVILFIDPDNAWVYTEAKRYYPSARYMAHGPPFEGTPLLYTVELSPNDLKAIQGLMASYRPGDTWEGPPNATRHEEALSANWPADAPIHLPFNAEWSGVLYVPRYGSYSFDLQAPTEAHLFLDEREVLTVGEGASRSRTGIMMAQGNHTIRLRAQGAPGLLQLKWQAPGETEMVIPPWATYLSPPVLARGLLGTYYPNPRWEGMPAMQRIDPVLDVYFHLTPLPRPYSVDWTGKVEIPLAGPCAFGLRSVDDSHLTIDGHPLLDANQGNTYVEATTVLTAGLHDIRVRFVDQTGRSNIHLYWAIPGGERQIIPSIHLYPPQGSYPQAVAAPPPPTESRPLALTPLAAWGEPGDRPGQFHEPRDIAVDSQGRVYVADTGNRRIQVLAPDGSFLAAWTGGEEPFVEPLAVVANSKDKIFVLDSEPGWIYVFTPDGTPAGRFGGPQAQLYHPRGMALDNADNLYVADTGGARIVIFDSGGGLIGIIGMMGHAPGQFLEPTDVAVDARAIRYVAEATNKRIQRLDVAGNYLGEWPIPQSIAYDGPHLALLPDETLLMTAPAQNEILRYALDGTVLGAWGGEGSQVGLFRLPVGLTIDARGKTLYVADTGNNRVQLFRLSEGG
jgi:4-amino-4-deoxy-L-arabinose transferase-like glycosyltransferase/streptogramin lyase